MHEWNTARDHIVGWWLVVGGWWFVVGVVGGSWLVWLGVGSWELLIGSWNIRQSPITNHKAKKGHSYEESSQNPRRGCGSRMGHHARAAGIGPAVEIAGGYSNGAAAPG